MSPFYFIFSISKAPKPQTEIELDLDKPSPSHKQLFRTQSFDGNVYKCRQNLPGITKADAAYNRLKISGF